MFVSLRRFAEARQEICQNLMGGMPAGDPAYERALRWMGGHRPRSRYGDVAAKSPLLEDFTMTTVVSTDPSRTGEIFDMSVMRERILAAAIEIAADRGFEACTVKAVATAVGIKAPGLYSHFPSKEAIITEAVSRVLTDFSVRVGGPVEPGEPEAALRETVRRHVLYQIENLRIATVTDLLLNRQSTHHFLPAADYASLLEVQRSYFNLVRDRVTAFAPTPLGATTTVASMAIIAMCDRVASWYRPDGALSANEVAEQHWQLARHMLGA
jgi:AcrR family transcriptional regulator